MFKHLPSAFPLFGVTVALLSAGVAFAQPGPGWGPGYGIGLGMMGGGMMGEAMGNYPVTPDWGGEVLDSAAARSYIQYGETHGAADAKANSVTFTGNDVVINLVAVQPGFEDQTFELHGLTNPTIIVPHGAKVQFNLLNMDYGNNMEHTAVITMTPPPYPYMSMMYLGQPQVPPMPELPWRSSDDIKSAHYAALGENFIASSLGEYWYVCPAPQHAQEGMYGKFIVR